MNDPAYEDYAAPDHRLPADYDLAEESSITTGQEDLGQSATEEPKPAPHFWEVKHLVFLAAGVFALLLIALLLAGLDEGTSVNSSSGEVERYQNEPLPRETQPRALEPEPERPLPHSESAPSTQVMIQRAAHGVVFIKTSASLLGLDVGTGTGFVINDSGYILTNQHVIDNADEYLIYFDDGSMSSAQLVAEDAALDVALLKVSEATFNRKLDLGNSEGIQIGQQVFALGYPLGTALGQEMTATDGIVSSIRANGGWFQVSAAVNPGNSGGPLIRRSSGEVIGVITAKVKDADNIGFARPINVCKEFVRQYTTF